MAKGYDKAAAADKAKAAVAAGMESIRTAVLALDTDAKWRHTLDLAAARNRLSSGRFSFGNILWLCAQGEERQIGVGMVATYAAWQKLGRQVRKGEKALQVLKPIPRQFTRQETDKATGELVDVTRQYLAFTVQAEFALSQTEGPELAQGDERVQGAPSFVAMTSTLRDVALALPDNIVRSVAIRARTEGDHPTANGWYNRVTREIVVISRDDASDFQVLVHEVAHAMLHGLDDHHATPVREVEAESVSYIVCRAFGVDCTSVAIPYVAAWGGGTKHAVDQIQKSGERIVSAAHRIIDALSAVDTAAEALAA